MNSSKIETIASKIILLIAFILPVSNFFASQLIILAFILSLFSPKIKTVLATLVKNKITLTLILLYSLTFFGFLYTSSPDKVWFDAEVKLAYIALPFVFTLLSIDIKKVLHFFVYGALTAGAICVINSSYLFYNTGEILSFFYGKFSILQHPSYFAMYLNFALCIVLINTKAKSINGLTVLKILFLLLTIILSGSKMGMITVTVTAITTIIVLFIKVKQKWVTIGITVITLIMGAGALSTEMVHKRITPLIKTLTGESEMKNDSNGTRISAWKASINSFKTHPIIGVNTSGVTGSLNAEYAQMGATKALKRSLNSHNEFLQYIVEYGIIGFSLFIFHFIFVFQSAIKNKNYYFLSFGILFVINCFVESMLERQSGVLFYTYFLSLFAISFTEKTIQPSNL